MKQIIVTYGEDEKSFSPSLLYVTIIETSPYQKIEIVATIVATKVATKKNKKKK